MTDQTDEIIKPPELRKRLNVCGETLRRMMKANKLPPFDVRLSQKTCGWRLSTLRAAGVDV
jgi:predicted DNA-binding transcriptional regulator AlpA